MTRILTISNLYPPHALGGYEWSCHDVMRRLVERGHEVAVVTTTTRFPGAVGGAVAIEHPVHRVLDWYWADHELVSPPLRDRIRIERRNDRLLRALLDEHRPEVVSVWNVGAMSLGLLRTVAERGIPMVFAVCDEWPVYAPAMDAWGRLFTRRPRLAAVAEALLRTPSAPVDLGPTGAWCFVSEYTRDACRSRSPFGFPISTVVHSGIEPDDFPLVEPEPDDAFDWSLLYVGRLDERKGVLTAVDALARLPSAATLTFVGVGDAADAIRDRANGHGLTERVTITAVRRSELAAVYRGADALLFTSEWDEPFGLTPIEAMACGTPVVGTGTGGSGAFLVDRRTCLRYPPGDAQALAATVEELAGDPELRRELRRHGHDLAAAMTTDRLADTFEAWHLAAAARFAGELPPDRRLPVIGA